MFFASIKQQVCSIDTENAKECARIISLYIVQDFGNILLGTVVSNIKRACGCTVFELDKKEYALSEEHNKSNLRRRQSHRLFALV
jgi:hypothetical protein